MASVNQLLADPGFSQFIEREEAVCRNFPDICARNRDTGGFLSSVFEVIPAQAIQALFPLFSIPGLLPSGVESAARAATEAVGVSRETFTTIKAVATPLLTSGALSSESLTTLGVNVADLFDFDFGSIFDSLDLGSIGQQLVSEIGIPLVAQEVLGSPGVPTINVAAPSRQAMQSVLGTAAAGAGGAIVGAGLSIISKDAVKLLLSKVAAFLGRKNITLSGTISLAKKLGQFIKDPAVIAASMGIAVSELALLLSANAGRKRRRMNPGNVTALRRSMRRVESFHRLCSRADMLRSRGRGRGRKGCASDGTRIVSVK